MNRMTFYPNSMCINDFLLERPDPRKLYPSLTQLNFFPIPTGPECKRLRRMCICILVLTSLTIGGLRVHPSDNSTQTPDPADYPGNSPRSRRSGHQKTGEDADQWKASQLICRQRCSFVEERVVRGGPRRSPLANRTSSVHHTALRPGERSGTDNIDPRLIYLLRFMVKSIIPSTVIDCTRCPESTDTLRLDKCSNTHNTL
ncbi:hypothetical protein E1301_Tti019727 [Triplophysa tibetana]|uniref:Uncharacterized protein n=1 Tax=Triplophysa tibetana TaxID=1572043 RepID=A0A5A9NA82_9TELE|nr:hypothetical protein E1301_Tti019727 [Triplophysa tibetana]